MGRRKICRMVAGPPRCRHYKPQGIPLKSIKELELTVEGFEAMRLVDAEGVSQADAAERMGVSRPTLNRTLSEARHTVATALSRGMALRIDGGDYLMADQNAEESALEDTDMRTRCMMAPGGKGGGKGRGIGPGMGQGQGMGRGQGMGQGRGMGQATGQGRCAGGSGMGRGMGQGQGMGRGMGRQGVFQNPDAAPSSADKAKQQPTNTDQPIEQRRTTMSSGKIAITADGPTLDSNVDPRFGRAAGFVIVDLETMETEYLDNGSSQVLSQGAGIQAAENVANAGAKVVLTGYVGPKAFQALSAAGIGIGQDLENMTIREAVEHYKAGKVNMADAPNREAHSGMGGR